MIHRQTWHESGKDAQRCLEGLQRTADDAGQVDSPTPSERQMADETTGRSLYQAISGKDRKMMLRIFDKQY